MLLCWGWPGRCATARSLTLHPPFFAHTCMSVLLAAPGNRDKKLAALDIVNVSIKIYFKLNTLRLCKNLIRTVRMRVWLHQCRSIGQFDASLMSMCKFGVDVSTEALIVPAARDICCPFVSAPNVHSPGV